MNYEDQHRHPQKAGRKGRSSGRQPLTYSPSLLPLAGMASLAVTSKSHQLLLHLLPILLNPVLLNLLKLLLKSFVFLGKFAVYEEYAFWLVD